MHTNIPKFNTVICENVFNSIIENEDINYNFEEVNQILEAMDMTDYLGEAADVTKASLKVLNKLTGDRWTNFTDEEKRDLMLNYTWTGSKFKPTGKARLKAFGASVEKSLSKEDSKLSASAIKAQNMIKNLKISDFIDKDTTLDFDKQKSKFNQIAKAVKEIPKGLTFGTIAIALAKGLYASIFTKPKNDNTDYAKQFDKNLVDGKKKIKGYVNNLKSNIENIMD